MTISSGSGVVRNGLVFHYDMSNTTKSWKGGPTTNYAWSVNAVQQPAYTKWNYTTDATWLANHPLAITTFNADGNSITGYVNTGVNSGNWQVTHHAHWQYDSGLKKPVVVMNDVDAQWKAKSWGMGQSMTSMGLGYGDQYTISWLQWTDNISKSANAGLYGQNTSGANGFHDGQSNGQSTSFNTKVCTWQRVYATFTVNAVRNLSATLSCYMYGHYGPRATIKVADVQIEPNSYMTLYSPVLTRSNTEALVDLTGNNTITANSLIYNSDGTFEFDGTTQDNYCTVTAGTELSAIRGTSNITAEAWVYYTSYSGGSESYSVITVWGNPWVWLLENPSNTLRFRITAGGADVNIADSETHPLNTWLHVVGTYDGATKKIYVNGELKNSSAQTGALASPGGTPKIGTFQGTNYCMSGKIGSVRIYNKDLTAEEVLQNFEAGRGRYGV